MDDKTILICKSCGWQGTRSQLIIKSASRKIYHIGKDVKTTDALPPESVGFCPKCEAAIYSTTKFLPFLTIETWGAND